MSRLKIYTFGFVLILALAISAGAQTAPVLDPIGSQNVDEGQNLSFIVTASDLDGTIAALSTSTLPANASFVDNGDNTGSFSFDPDYDQSSVINITFYAADTVTTDIDSEIVAITVNNINQSPVVNLDNPADGDSTADAYMDLGTTVTDEGLLTVRIYGDQTASPTDLLYVEENVTGGSTVTHRWSGSVLNPESPYTMGLWHFDENTGTTFSDESEHGNTGNLNYDPVWTVDGAFGYALDLDGDHDYMSVPDDTSLDVSTSGAITMEVWVYPREINSIYNTIIAKRAFGGSSTNYQMSLDSAGGTLMYYSTGAGVRTSSVTVPTNEWSYLAVTVDATSGNIIFYRNGVAGDTLTGGVIGSPNDDSLFIGMGYDTLYSFDGLIDEVRLTKRALSASEIAANYELTDGTYYWRVEAEDDSAVTANSAVRSFSKYTELPPVLSAIGAKAVDEGQNLNFGISASDPNGTTPSLTAENVPTNATFVDNGNGTGTFNFNPDYTQATVYNVSFIASDGLLADTEVVEITVNQVNLPPVLNTIGNRSVDENQSLSFTVLASDPDGTIPSLLTSALPLNATFIDNGNGSGDFSFDPDFTQASVYEITFYASDGLVADSEVVSITVNNINQLPVLNPIGSKLTNEGQNLNFDVTASDPDGNIPTLSAFNLPTNASFVDNGDGSGTFDFTPAFTQSGDYDVTFYADDGIAIDSEIVTITVVNVNQVPVLATIGNQSILENNNLHITVSATDADGEIPSLSTTSLPANATFIDNGDGTGDFNFDPDFTQAGSYPVTFYATDGLATDSELVTITVQEAGNQVPVLSSIGPKSATEGGNISFGLSATDAEGVPPILSSSALPVGASLVDNGDGTGNFAWTPDYTQSGIFNITFYATDDSSAVDSEIVTFTINEAGNQNPTLNSIGNRFVVEGNNLNFTVTASDPEGVPPTLSTTTLPPNASFVDNGDGTGSFSFDPDYTQSGVYNITFTATDDSTATDSEPVTITVTEAGNQDPILTSIGNQSVTEGNTLNFAVTATDPELDIPSLSTSSLPPNANFVDNGDGSGSFTFNPDFTQFGVYNITFYAYDDLAAADSEVIAITVTEAGNQDPVLATIGARSVLEGNNLNFGVYAIDAEGATPVLTVTGLPSGALFTDNGDGTGNFDWTPTYIQAGIYNVIFYATDDSTAVDSEVVEITVNEAGNQNPVLVSIGNKTVVEGEVLNFVVTASDAEGASPVLTTSTLPSNASFIDNGDGTGSFSFSPNFTQSGVYVVSFYATDDSLAVDSEQINITVFESGNQAPILDSIGDKVVVEGNNLNFNVSATNADGPAPTLSTSLLPTNASFVDNGNGTGEFNFDPDFTQSGIYNITFYASDGIATDSEIVVVTVNEAGNQAPILSTIGTQNVTEGQNLNLPIFASDPDGTIPALSTGTLPANATFIDNGDGTGMFDFIPGYLQSGIISVTFYASDGLVSDSEVVFITVVDAGNQAPSLAAIGPRQVVEGNILNVNVSATDPEDTSPALSTSTLPTNAGFVDNGDGTGVFSFSPSFVQAGTYNVTFYATDDSLAVDSEIVTVTVLEAGNQNPEIDPVTPKVVAENSNLNFNITATDPDGTIPLLSSSTLPTNATFIDNGVGSGTFNWTPSFTQAGIYSVTFYATDGTGGADSTVVSITVNNTNQPPILSPIGPKQVDELAILNFTVTASDPDLTVPTLTTSTLPTNATFIDNGNSTGSFNFTPTNLQAGTYNVTFYVNDGEDIDSEIVTITVNDINQRPILDPIGLLYVTEGDNLYQLITAGDPDGNFPVLTTSALPPNATFVDNADGTADFNFNPSYTQAGIVRVTFYASDGILVDSEVVFITIQEAGNQSPVLGVISNQSITEGQDLNFIITASDPDGTIPSLSAVDLPGGASFINNGNGTATFDWTPDFNQSGTYDITFYASDGSLADSSIVTISVIEAGNQPPVLSFIGNKTTTEGVLLSFAVSASDADGPAPTLTATNLPTGANFTDNLNGTGNFNWTPNYTQAGTYNVTFRASDGSLADSEIVTITVAESGNQAPVIAAISPKTTTENVNLNFTVTATDPEGVTPSLNAVNLPSGATFVDNGNGTGTFNWTPSFTQSGIYNVTFRASDGVLTDAEIAEITVNDAGNQAPILATVGARSTAENLNLNFAVSATDPDGSIPSISATGIPTGATFTNNGNGTGSFNWTPGFTDAGIYNVTFIASDGTLADSEVVEITVLEAGNQAPILATIGSKNIIENVSLNFSVSATDPDATIPSLTTSGLPSGAAFVDNSNGTGSFSWTPSYIQSGTYNITFIASDGALSDSEIVVVTVQDAGNQAPVVVSIPPQNIAENTNLTFTVTSTDPDATIPALSARNLPGGASFVDNGDGSGSFNWTPTYTQSGVYNVLFIASDGIRADSETAVITVQEAGNQAPVLATIGSRGTTEGVNLSFSISASDPDGTTPSLSAAGLPSGASFVNIGNGTGTFSWIPGYTESGTYNVTFIASDGSLADSEMVVITIQDAGNQRPVLASIGSKSVTENVNLNFSVTTTDPDATTPLLYTSSLPAGASFLDNGNGTGTFNWTPNFTQAGIHNIIFIASDGALADSEVVVITVNEAGNQPPVLATIGPKNVIENNNLNFIVSATDPDGTIPSLSATGLPGGASFVNNGNGTGTFNWTPNFTQAGIYDVTIVASDGSLTDFEIVQITVNEAGNQSPVLAAIGSRGTTEDVTLNFAISATDPDGNTPSLTANNLPGGATFVDNSDGTGTFGWTPDFTQAGTYNVLFIASDGSLADSENVTVTVLESGNQAPILASIGPKNTTENINLNFTVSATDPDASTPLLSVTGLPSGANFVDNGNGTGTFNWIPNFTQAGSYNVIFIASDLVLADSEAVVITVNEAGNQAPVLAFIGPKSTTENVNLNFTITATDPDGTIPTLSGTSLPTGATFVNNGNGTGTFNWTPGFTQSGVYNVTFIASDGTLDDAEVVQITVNEAGNQSPILATIGSKVTTENVLLNFSVSASDPDGTTPNLSAINLPGSATFNDNGNGTGSFSWRPGFTDAGMYNITFIAGDGLLTDTEIVTITVAEAGNQQPVLAAIGARSTTENINLNFSISATDPDATIPTLSASSLPAGASFVDNGNGSGIFNWTPNFVQAGVYSVTFVASDGALTDFEIVQITVLESGNQAPVLATIGSRSTNENVNLNFSISAADPDGTVPGLSATGLPSGATFVDHGNGTGTFNWTPNFTQAGTYDVTFIASDGSLIDAEVVEITVNESGNQAPVLALIGPRGTTENVNLNFSVSASDPDATIPALAATGLPGGATFTDNGNGSGTLNWTPSFTAAGSYNITFIASDGLLADSEIVVITVQEAGNQAPVLATIGPRGTTENVNLNFVISAADPDATIPTLSTSGVPSGATFIDNGDGTGTFNWTPNFTQAGNYSVTFIASDGVLNDIEVVSITVNEAGNQAPILATIGSKFTVENINLNFTATATDPDGTTPAMSATGLPAGATFVDNGNGTGTFNWTPAFTSAGIYNITVIASDGTLTDNEVVQITVNEAGNQAPALSGIGPRSITENVNLNFSVTANDPDATTPTLSAVGLPAGASFVDNGNGSGTFNWTPGYTEAGSYNVTFVASDGVLADSEVVSITVIDAGNQRPVLATIGPKGTTEDVNLNFNISATDPDATIPSLTASGLPTGATFVNNGNGTGTFNWTPDFTQAGVYYVTFIATDGALADSEVAEITVVELGNQPPVLATIGARGTTENVTLNFNISASDPDATVPSLSAVNLPEGATFVSNGNGTGTFNWLPNFTQAGVYNVTFIASDGVLTDSEVVTITVNEAGNQAPVLATIGAKSTGENVNLNFSISATDLDLTIPALSVVNLPLNASFVDNGDGTGVFNWTPNYTQAGPYNVTFIATDGTLADSEVVAITVVEAGNQRPVLAAIGFQGTTENVNLNFNMSGSDPDATVPTLSASGVPSGATFLDNGDGTGVFNWTPNFTQAGIYNVTFIVSDGVLSDSEVVVITVVEAGNQSPVLALIGPKSTPENVNLNFSISATDPDGTTPALTANNLPTGATFVNNGDGTGTFNWTPNFIQAGVYNVTFTASDGVLIDNEIVEITVTESGNQAPILTAIGPKSTTENLILNFSVSATDPDETVPALSATNVPSGATFADNGDGTGTFNWRPNFIQAGTYNVTFIASDGPLADSEIVEITVNEAGNQAPVLAAIGPKSITENMLLNFTISATDPDTTTPSLSITGLPFGASFTDNGDGTGTFSWLPSYTQAGGYQVTFLASDGDLTDVEVVNINVLEAGNQRPFLTAIGSRSTSENVNLNFGISASDPDATIPVLTAVGTPSGASFVDNHDGTGTFNWTPDFTQAGVYNVTFIASDGVLADSEVVTVTVNDSGNQAPILAAIGSRSTTENVNLNFSVSASDPDATIPSLSATGLPSGATFIDNANGTGTFNWTPDFTQASVYNVTFITSDGTLADSEVVAITVNEAGNQVPILATIGPRGTTEDVNLNFTVTATDPDGTIPTLSANDLPSGATFVDNADGTGTFDWTPNFTQSGTYNVTFIASDGSLIDAEVVLVTVNEIGNQEPDLASIGPKSTTENVNLNFSVSATDADATIPSLSAAGLPAGASFTDNSNGTGTFNWTPNFTQAGVYNVTFIASDGTLADSEVVAITVNEAGNQVPILATIGSRSTTENINLSFNINASDVDGTTPILSAVNLPVGASFIDNTNGTGSFNWTPDYTQAGAFNVTFIASDGSLADSEVVQITVLEAGNQRPVLATIGPRATAENVNLNFAISASDQDATIPILSAVGLPGGAALTDNLDGTGVFNWTPDFTQAGVYNITFIASDGLLADTEVVQITVVEAGNQRPMLAAIGPRSTSENVNLNFNISASDPDATIPALSAIGIPSGASFVDHANGTGTFNWTPNFTQAGDYNVTFIASDGVLADSEVVVITINESGNQAPVLATIGPRSTNENANLNFNISASDPDATIPSLSAVGLPTGATFIDNANGTGTFNWLPNFTQAGIYNVTFIASDGTLADSEVVAITVNEAGNQAPILATIGSKSTTENINLNFALSAVDPDSTIPSLSATGLPSGATFVNNGDGTGTFDWTPNFTQSGSYQVTFIASDGSLVDAEVVDINVFEAGNQRPVLAAIGPQATTEDVNLNFVVTATDPDVTTPALSATNLPTGASFVNNGDGSGVFNWTPGFTQAGVYNVTFIAADASLADSEIVEITVSESGNQAPVLAAIGSKSTTENINLNFTISASDPDATIPSLSASGLPTGATFVDNGDGTGTFNWLPNYIQAGVYNVTFTASDGSLFDNEIVGITVNEAGNQPPTLATIGSKTGSENNPLTFNISATDPDSTIPVLSTSTLPSGATFIDNGDGTGTFDWIPNYTQAGVYNVTFTVSDGSLTDNEIVEITITEAGNQRPILASIGPRATTENVNLNFTITASDPDATIPVLMVVGLPSGASFVDNANGTGIFNWTPDFTQAGIYNVTFIASDGVLADSEVVVITINDSGNQAPVLASIGPRTTAENVNLTFIISASDPDATTPFFTTSNMPSGASFVDNGNGTGTFSWRPNFIQSGTYNVTFVASDGSLADSEIVVITVNEAGNQIPILATIGPKSTTENINLNFNVSAVDPDSTVPSLSATGLPSGATFVDNGDGTGTFNWTPNFTQSGLYQVTFVASDGILDDAEVVNINVFEAGNQYPILASIGPRATTENVNLNFVISATDPDATIPVLFASNLPTGASLVDNSNGTATFNWMPNFTQAGTYNVIFVASDGSLADSEIVQITVQEAGNQAPVLALIGSKSTSENVNLNFAVTASDADGTFPILSAAPLPSGATFTDNGNGTGVFNWTPDYTQEGLYNVTFAATDGSLADSEVVQIAVVGAGNQAPVLASIGSRSTDENVNLNFIVTAVDPDSTIPILSSSTLPSGATFIDNGDGTGVFDWTPTFIQSGIVSVTFRVTDGSLSDSEVVFITVFDVGNQPPVLDLIGSQTVTEGQNLTFGVSASDPEGVPPTLTTSTLPTNAVFTDNGDGTGLFTFDPEYTQASVYNIIFYTTDDSLAVDSEIVTITVNEAGNQAPVLAAIGSQSVLEGMNLNFNITATDADSTIPLLTAENIPVNATFIDNGDGTGTFNFNPNYIQNGSYNVTFIASDGSLADSEIVPITVIEAGNQTPVLAAIGAQSVLEGTGLNFGISATDPDSTIPTLTAENVPTNATFVDNGDGTGTFDFNPSYNQAGSYDVTFIASDGSLSDTEIVTVTVNEAGNRVPELASIGAQSVLEGANLNFGVSATDADSTIPVLTAENVPVNATFLDNGDGTGVFDFNPDYIQAGSYNVTFIASDGSLADSEIVTITVNEAGNQAPVLANIGAQSFLEGTNLNFNITATDADSTIPVLTAENIPTNATFFDNGDGTAVFDFNPNYIQAGVYNVLFIASDGLLADSEAVAITVNEAGNQVPELAAIGARSVPEGGNLNFAVSATDADSTMPVLTAENIPTNATFVDNGDGTGVFDFNPDYTQAGIYDVTFIASDGSLADSEIVTITVTDAGNQTPVLAAIGPRMVDEGANLNFNISATDADSTIPILTAENIPTNATFFDNGDGTGTLDFNPDYTQSGTYDVLFIASDGSLADSELVTITVNHVNLAPFADAGFDQVDVPAGPIITLDGTASYDPDGDPLNYSWVQIGGQAVTLSSDTDSMPTFTTTTPDDYIFELTVDDNFLLSAPDTVVIGVVNGAPPLPVGDLSIQIVGDALQLDWSAVMNDTAGFAVTIDRYVIYRGVSAYFTPTDLDSIGAVDGLTVTFTDNDIGGVNVVGDTLTQYFYTIRAVDIYGNRSVISNRVGEYDYQILITATTDYNLVGIPFSNTGITNAVGLISALGSGNVNTVNTYIPSSQSYVSRFAAGFGTNFAVTVGGVYQINAAANTIFSVAGNVPDSGTVSYPIITTATTDYNFIMIPFELENNFSVAQDVINYIPGVLNTLNNFRAESQSYVSRFAAGFGTNFPVKAGKPYQANAATAGAFPE